ncbi:MAG: hypothetical protein HKP27_04725, partial [Myxococcales bacterium]|nr:hypothetical protein [Myxococcales bacterium]
MQAPEPLTAQRSGGALARVSGGLSRLPERAPSARGQPPARTEHLQAVAPQRLPNRYRTERSGGVGLIRCVEAPTLVIRVERDRSVPAAHARAAPAGTIFLDGAAQGEPFTDPARAVYNLDHHEGCVRAFTLATCEQAMVLVRKRLDLGRRDWTVHANDADLDATLAIWVLLNHLRLAQDGELRAAILPLLRLEGAIDAWGLECRDLCGLSAQDLARADRQMALLRKRELDAKSRGRWDKIDLASFIADRLRDIDRMVYQAEDFVDAVDVQELARCELTGGSVAVVCRARTGIYEVERELRRYHGDRLGLIVLQKDERNYSIRQVDPCLPVGLDRVYERLNLIDPKSGGSAAADRWGGSSDIGGSPRESGTGLSPREIATACHDAHSRRLGTRVHALARGLFAPALLLPATWLLANSASASLGQPLVYLLGACLFALAGAGLLFAGHRRPGLYGLRSPHGLEGYAMLPIATGVGFALSYGTPGFVLPNLSLVAGLGLAVGAFGWELLFRGLVHGTLAYAHHIQVPGGRRFLSWPTLWSAALSASLCAALLI